MCRFLRFTSRFFGLWVFFVVRGFLLCRGWMGFVISLNKVGLLGLLRLTLRLICDLRGVFLEVLS